MFDNPNNWPGITLRDLRLLVFEVHELASGGICGCCSNAYLQGAENALSGFRCTPFIGENTRGPFGPVFFLVPFSLCCTLWVAPASITVGDSRYSSRCGTRVVAHSSYLYHPGTDELLELISISQSHVSFGSSGWNSTEDNLMFEYLFGTQPFWTIHPLVFSPDNRSTGAHFSKLLSSN